jgi:hypothetical protein
MVSHAQFSEILHLYEKHFTSRDFGWDCPEMRRGEMLPDVRMSILLAGLSGFFGREPTSHSVSYADFWILQAIVRSVPVQMDRRLQYIALVVPVLSQRQSRITIFSEGWSRPVIDVLPFCRGIVLWVKNAE